MNDVQSYYAKNMEKIKARSLQYYHANRDRLIAKHKEYDKLHADRKRKRNAEKLTCECGRTHRRDGKIDHLASKYHQEWVTSNIISNSIDKDGTDNEL